MTSLIFADRRSRRARGFTLLEVLTTLAFLVVVMGLMVSLARYVRAQSAQQYTRRLLAELELAQRQYVAMMPPGPEISLGILPGGGSTGGSVEEEQAKAYVEKINGPYVAALLQHLHPTEQQTTVRDAWGNPIGYLPSQNPGIGMAPENRPFFFSAGPDGRFLTRQDNLYSYEQIKPGDLPDLPVPMTAGPLDSANNAPATAPGRDVH